VAHVILLLLVAGEDANLAKVGIEEVLEDGGTKGAGAACDHEGGVGECGHILFLQSNSV